MIIETILRKTVSHVLKKVCLTFQELAGKVESLETRIEKQQTEVRSLAKEIENLKSSKAEIIQTGAGPSQIYFANILFTCPMSDQNGVPLQGTTADAFNYSYSMTVVGNNGAEVINSRVNIGNATSPTFINAEVVGDGEIIVNLQQRIVINGYTTLMNMEMCRVQVMRGQSEYRVTEFACWPIQQLVQFALYNQPRIAADM